MTSKFSPVERHNKLMGEVYRAEISKDVEAVVFFGSRHASWEILPELFPGLHFARLKQTHGNAVVPASEETICEADGHWTESKDLALTIVTADCLPILVVDKTSQRVGAVHAGWRGVENEILIKLLKKEFSNSKDIDGFIGPHIRQESFEVGPDVWQRDPFNQSEYISSHIDEQKKYLNLTKIAQKQLQDLGVKSIFTSQINTFTNSDYASYRRKENIKSRQISFVALSRRRR